MNRQKGHNLKQSMQAITSSKQDSWFTPPEYIAAVRSVLGEIDLDPASCEQANKIVGAKEFYTESDFSLLRAWQGKVFLNPPYGKVSGKSQAGAFAAKLALSYDTGDVTEAIILVPLYFAYKWFAPLRDKPVCLLDHRIRFIDGVTGIRGDEALQSHAFYYFGRNPKKFFKEFANFGCTAVFKKYDSLKG